MSNIFQTLVSIVHWLLTWTTGSLTCVYIINVIFLHASYYHMHRGPWFIVSSEGLRHSLHRIWLQRNLRVQSPACNGHPSIWWPHLTVLNFGFRDHWLYVFSWGTWYTATTTTLTVGNKANKHLTFKTSFAQKLHLKLPMFVREYLAKHSSPQRPQHWTVSLPTTCLH